MMVSSKNTLSLTIDCGLQQQVGSNDEKDLEKTPEYPLSDDHPLALTNRSLLRNQCLAKVPKWLTETPSSSIDISWSTNRFKDFAHDSKPNQSSLIRLTPKEQMMLQNRCSRLQTSSIRSCHSSDSFSLSSSPSSSSSSSPSSLSSMSHSSNFILISSGSYTTSNCNQKSSLYYSSPTSSSVDTVSSVTTISSSSFLSSLTSSKKNGIRSIDLSKLPKKSEQKTQTTHESNESRQHGNYSTKDSRKCPSKSSHPGGSTHGKTHPKDGENSTSLNHVITKQGKDKTNSLGKTSGKFTIISGSPGPESLTKIHCVNSTVSKDNNSTMIKRRQNHNVFKKNSNDDSYQLKRNRQKGQPCKQILKSPSDRMALENETPMPCLITLDNDDKSAPPLLSPVNYMNIVLEDNYPCSNLPPKLSPMVEEQSLKTLSPMNDSSSDCEGNGHIEIQISSLAVKGPSNLNSNNECDPISSPESNKELLSESLNKNVFSANTSIAKQVTEPISSLSCNTTNNDPAVLPLNAIKNNSIKPSIGNNSTLEKEKSSLGENVKSVESNAYLLCYPYPNRNNHLKDIEKQKNECLKHNLTDGMHESETTLLCSSKTIENEISLENNDQSSRIISPHSHRLPNVNIYPGYSSASPNANDCAGNINSTHVLSIENDVIGQSDIRASKTEVSPPHSSPSDVESRRTSVSDKSIEDDGHSQPKPTAISEENTTAYTPKDTDVANDLLKDTTDDHIQNQENFRSTSSVLSHLSTFHSACSNTRQPRQLNKHIVEIFSDDSVDDELKDMFNSMTFSKSKKVTSKTSTHGSSLKDNEQLDLTNIASSSAQHSKHGVNNANREMQTSSSVGHSRNVDLFGESDEQGLENIFSSIGLNSSVRIQKHEVTFLNDRHSVFDVSNLDMENDETPPRTLLPMNEVLSCVPGERSYSKLALNAIRAKKKCLEKYNLPTENEVLQLFLRQHRKRKKTKSRKQWTDKNSEANSNNIFGKLKHNECIDLTEHNRVVSTSSVNVDASENDNLTKQADKHDDCKHNIVNLTVNAPNSLSNETSSSISSMNTQSDDKSFSLLNSSPTVNYTVVTHSTNNLYSIVKQEFDKIETLNDSHSDQSGTKIKDQQGNNSCNNSSPPLLCIPEFSPVIDPFKLDSIKKYSLSIGRTQKAEMAQRIEDILSRNSAKLAETLKDIPQAPSYVSSLNSDSCSGTISPASHNDESIVESLVSEEIPKYTIHVSCNDDTAISKSSITVSPLPFTSSIKPECVMDFPKCSVVDPLTDMKLPIPVSNITIPVWNIPIPVSNISTRVLDNQNVASNDPACDSIIPMYVSNTQIDALNIPIPVSNSQISCSNIPVPISNISIPVSNIPTQDSNIPIPVSNIKIPVCNTEIDTLNIQIPVSNSQIPCSNVPNSILNSPTQVSSIPIPVSNIQIRVPKSPSLDWNIHTPVSNIKISVSNSQTSVSNIPTKAYNIPTQVSSIPISDLNIPTQDLNIPIPVSDISTPVSNIPTPVSNIQIPISNIQTQDSNIPIPVSNIPIPVPSIPNQHSNIPIPISNIPIPVSIIPIQVSNIHTRVSNISIPVSHNQPPFSSISASDSNISIYGSNTPTHLSKIPTIGANISTHVPIMTTSISNVRCSIDPILDLNVSPHKSNGTTSTSSDCCNVMNIPKTDLDVQEPDSNAMSVYHYESSTPNVTNVTDGGSYVTHPESSIMNVTSHDSIGTTATHHKSNISKVNNHDSIGTNVTYPDLDITNATYQDSFVKYVTYRNLSTPEVDLNISDPDYSVIHVPKPDLNVTNVTYSDSIAANISNPISKHTTVKNLDSNVTSVSSHSSNITNASIPYSNDTITCSNSHTFANHHLNLSSSNLNATNVLSLDSNLSIASSNVPKYSSLSPDSPLSTDNQYTVCTEKNKNPISAIQKGQSNEIEVHQTSSGDRAHYKTVWKTQFLTGLPLNYESNDFRSSKTNNDPNAAKTHESLENTLDVSITRDELNSEVSKSETSTSEKKKRGRKKRIQTSSVKQQGKSERKNTHDSNQFPNSEKREPEHPFTKYNPPKHEHPIQQQPGVSMPYVPSSYNSMAQSYYFPNSVYLGQVANQNVISTNVQSPHPSPIQVNLDAKIAPTSSVKLKPTQKVKPHQNQTVPLKRKATTPHDGVSYAKVPKDNSGVKFLEVLPTNYSPLNNLINHKNKVNINYDAVDEKPFPKILKSSVQNEYVQAAHSTHPFYPNHQHSMVHPDSYQAVRIIPRNENVDNYVYCVPTNYETGIDLSVHNNAYDKKMYSNVKTQYHYWNVDARENRNVLRSYPPVPDLISPHLAYNSVPAMSPNSFQPLRHPCHQSEGAGNITTATTPISYRPETFPDEIRPLRSYPTFGHEERISPIDYTNSSNSNNYPSFVNQRININNSNYSPYPDRTHPTNQLTTQAPSYPYYNGPSIISMQHNKSFLGANQQFSARESPTQSKVLSEFPEISMQLISSQIKNSYDLINQYPNIPRSGILPDSLPSYVKYNGYSHGTIAPSVNSIANKEREVSVLLASMTQLKHS